MEDRPKIGLCIFQQVVARTEDVEFHLWSELGPAESGRGVRVQLQSSHQDVSKSGTPGRRRSVSYL